MNTDWNHKKIKCITDYYGHENFNNKNLLDLGSGNGDIANAFSRLGAAVTCIDDAKNTSIISKKYKHLKIINADLDNHWPIPINVTFDYILSIDLLCYLNNVRNHIIQLCKSGKNIILETSVCDSDNDDQITQLLPDNKIENHSLNNINSFPSSSYIEKILIENDMQFKRFDSKKINSGTFIYNWPVLNSLNCSFNNRRIWFISKKNVIVNKDNGLIINTSNKIKSNNENIISLLESSKFNNNENILINNNIKTALCLSGYLRTFEQNFNHLNKFIIEPLNCDIFIHIWDTVGLSLRGFDKSTKDINVNNILHKINAMYKPKLIVIEQSRNFNFNTKILELKNFENRDVNGLMAMFYKIKQCNQLKLQYEKENNFSYDYVIRYRPDILIKQSLNVKDLNNDFINIPKHGDFGGINDQFAIGNSKNMNIYSNIYDNILKYISMNIPLNPEKILKFHLEYNQLRIKRFDFRYIIKRSSGSDQDNMLLEKAHGFIK